LLVLFINNTNVNQLKDTLGDFYHA